MTSLIVPAGMHGLSAHEAAERRAAEGANDLAPTRSASSTAAWLIRLVADPMVILLAVAGGTYVVLGDRFDAIVSLSALLPIFFVSAILEWRSERALERLRDLAAPTARVVRDGIETTILTRDIVRGDLVLLREGDIVPADGTTVQSTDLSIDESALTGESLPVEKHPPTEATIDLFAGTTVRSGRGAMIVERIGGATEYGKIAERLAHLRDPQTPIERSIHRIVAQLGSAVVVLCIFVIALSRLHGDAWAAAIIAGVSLAMAAIPEELPMVYTLYLALGAWRLARDRALVRKLGSVEALGSVTVICVDKTGTITHGTLALIEAIPAADVSTVEMRALLAACADPHSGDPIDDAIARFLHGDTSNATVVRAVPFDAARRYSGNVVRLDGARRIVLKGAAEMLLGIADRDAGTLRERAERLAERGHRVLALGIADEATFDPAEPRLHIVAILGFADPVRDDAAAALEECRHAGIRTMMITGDHAATALAIASQIGLTTDPARVVTGEQLDHLGDVDLCRRISDYDVIARARPEHKLRIVQALHANEAVVAMTGDGTNDALALRAADIGIAMGKRGTEVAREAADLVLLDDRFATIVGAIKDGRRIFDNLKHAFAYLVSFHAPLLISAIVIPLIGAPLLLLPVHLVWLEIIVHPTSALVFENDASDPRVMERGPRDAHAALFSPFEWTRTIVLGVILSLAVLGFYLGLLRLGYPADAARAASIVAMICGQIALVLAERAPGRPMWSVSFASNKSIVPILLGTVATLAAAIYLPSIARALHFAHVDARTLLVAIALGIASVLWPQPLLWLRGRHAQERAHAG